MAERETIKLKIQHAREERERGKEGKATRVQQGEVEKRSVIRIQNENCMRQHSSHEQKHATANRLGCEFKQEDSSKHTDTIRQGPADSGKNRHINEGPPVRGIRKESARTIA